MTVELRQKWRLVLPRSATQEALAVAEEIDGLVVGMPTELLKTMREAKSEINDERSAHRTTISTRSNRS